MKPFETTDRNEAMNFLTSLLGITNEQIEAIQEKYSFINDKDDFIKSPKYDANRNRIYRIDAKCLENLVVNRVFQKIKGFEKRSDTKGFLQTIINK